MTKRNGRHVHAQKISSPTTNDFSPPPLALSLEVKFDTFFNALSKMDEEESAFGSKSVQRCYLTRPFSGRTTKSIAGFSL